MKRRKTILCTILVLLAVSLAGLFWWQRDNLKAIHAATQHTSAELEEKLEENQQMIQEAVKAAGKVTVGEISEEDRQAFRDGSMTQEELVERLTNGGEGEPREEPASTRGYLSRASALEKECDGKMDEIVRAMEKLLRENDGDLGLVDTVVYTYANEKSLKKSWYMSKLEQKGLL